MIQWARDGSSLARSSGIRGASRPGRGAVPGAPGPGPRGLRSPLLRPDPRRPLLPGSARDRGARGARGAERLAPGPRVPSVLRVRGAAGIAGPALRQPRAQPRLPRGCAGSRASARLGAAPEQQLRLLLRERLPRVRRFRVPRGCLRRLLRPLPGAPERRAPRRAPRRDPRRGRKAGPRAQLRQRRLQAAPAALRVRLLPVDRAALRSGVERRRLQRGRAGQHQHAPRRRFVDAERRANARPRAAGLRAGRSGRAAPAPGGGGPGRPTHSPGARPRTGPARRNLGAGRSAPAQGRRAPPGAGFRSSRPRGRGGRPRALARPGPAGRAGARRRGRNARKDRRRVVPGVEHDGGPRPGARRALRARPPAQPVRQRPPVLGGRAPHRAERRVSVCRARPRPLPGPAGPRAGVPRRRDRFLRRHGGLRRGERGRVCGRLLPPEPARHRPSRRPAGGVARLPERSPGRGARFSGARLRGP